MFLHSTNTASVFSVFFAALIFSLSLGGVAAAQGNAKLGSGALKKNTTGSLNTASGYNALGGNTTGNYNTANGAYALSNNDTGSSNTASGVNALLNTTGNNNTASGHSALVTNTTGTNNTASGINALAGNTIGNNNTGSGAFSLVNNATGTNNTAVGVNALLNSTGNNNTASGLSALSGNTTGNNNTAVGLIALAGNITGNNNTAIGFGANVSAGNLTNATAIGFGAIVNGSNQIELGNDAITRIHGRVAYTFGSDKTKKENFQPVDGESVLEKIRGFELTSWNFIGHDPKEFRHYGPMAQDLFAAFGHDGVGQIGTETTINSGDMAGILMIAVQALEKRTAELKQKEAQIAELAARLEALELQKNHPIQITAGKSLGDQ